jgi:hypothetical protein
VRQSYSYSVPSPHRMFKNSSTELSVCQPKLVHQLEINLNQFALVVLPLATAHKPFFETSHYLFFHVKDSLFVSHMDWSVEESAGTMGETVARLTLPCLTHRYYSVKQLTVQRKTVPYC